MRILAILLLCLLSYTNGHASQPSAPTSLARRVNNIAELRELLRTPQSDLQVTLAAGNHVLDDTLLLSQLTRFSLDGEPGTVLLLAQSLYIAFELGDLLQDVRISNLQFIGAAATAPGSRVHALGSHEGGVRIKQLELSNLTIEQVAVGISVGSCPTEGSVRGVKILNNAISQIIGDDSGSGYGIHSACAHEVEIANNVVQHAARHSIYVGKGKQVWLHDNRLTAHASALSQRLPRPYWRTAIAIARTRQVSAINNRIEASEDVSLSVEHDGTQDASGVCLQGNQITDQVAHLPELWINVLPNTRVVWIAPLPVRSYVQSGRLRTATAPTATLFCQKPW